MKLKNFNPPIWKDFIQLHKKETGYREKIGDYKLEIDWEWKNDIEGWYEYNLIISICDRELFSQSIRFYKHEEERFKQWYETSCEKGLEFFNQYMKTTYVERN